jgi:hypothetical protein
VTSNQTQLKPVRIAAYHDDTNHRSKPIAHCEHAFKPPKPAISSASVFQDSNDVAMEDIMEGDREISGVLHLLEC